MDIEMQRSQPDHVDVAVVGAGLAGLTAAAIAARDGASVVVFEAHQPGGRASTDDREGVLLNRGAHALYRKGPGMGVLNRLGVRVVGHAPQIKGTMGLRSGELHRFPASAASLMRSGLLRGSSKAALGRFLGRALRQRPSDWSDRTVSQWFDDGGLPDDARQVMGTIVRLTTYIADHQRGSADVAISQFQMGRAGVLYLDGGWATLVEGLTRAAVAHGARIERHAVRRIEPCSGGGFDLKLDEHDMHARTVVLAAGPVASCRSTLPFEPTAWAALAGPVEAACLDMALTDVPAHRIVLGVGEPTYFSTHGPPARLGGGTVAHAMRYLTDGDDAAPAQTREALAHIATVAGATIASSRYLHRMIVVGATPTPASGGLANRPGVAVADTAGLFVAGDWIGPEGFLSDASLASGEAAGAAAARLAGAVTVSTASRR